MATAAAPNVYDMLGAALAYLDDAWSIFPVCSPSNRPGHCQQHGKCKSPGKTPLVRWGEYQDRIASQSEIEAFWKKWPTANIGLCTGATSGVVVIDLDGEVARAEANRRGYEFGPWVRTGRIGGQHLYFQHREDAPTIFAKVGGIDFRGQGGFVLLPPSLHKDGARYSWGEIVHRGDPLPVLPRWIDELAVTSPDGEVRKKIDFGRLFSDGIPEGERDQTLFRTAAKLRGVDLPYEAAVITILQLAELCHPPFDPEQARAKVDSAYGRYTPNQIPHENPDDPISAAALVRMQLPEPRWAVPGLFPEGVVLLVGKSKLGKSWLVLDVALAVAGKARVWGKIDVEQGDVLYLALEDSKRRLQDRLLTLCGPQAPVRLDIVTRWTRADEGGIERILTWLDSHPQARMVVIDVLGKFRPREANMRRLYDMDYDAIAPLAEVARSRGVCVVVIHHTNKLNPEDPVDSVSGTTGLAGAADAIAILRRERGNADASLFVVGRDVEEQELALRRCLHEGMGNAWALMGDAAATRLSRERQQIVEAVAAQPGMKPSEIAGATGRAAGPVRYLLFKMTQEGQIRFRDGAYYPNSLYTTANTANALTPEPKSNSKTEPVFYESTANAPLTPLTRPVSVVSPVSGVSGNSNVRADERSQKPLCPVHHVGWDDHECEAL